jgi:hypothetical protein
MSGHQLIEQAEQCRVRARKATAPERELLFKIADAFEEMATAAEARRTIDETRCW